jgi:hypothetical protein
MGKAVTRAAQLRAEAEALREKLNDEISPMTRHRVQTLIDELEAEARSFDNGDAQRTRHNKRHTGDASRLRTLPQLASLVELGRQPLVSFRNLQARRAIWIGPRQSGGFLAPGLARSR